MAGGRWPIVLAIYVLLVSANGALDTDFVTSEVRGPTEDNDYPICAVDSLNHAVVNADSEIACRYTLKTIPNCPDIENCTFFLNNGGSEQQFMQVGSEIVIYLKETQMNGYKLLYKCFQSATPISTFVQIAVGKPPIDIENLLCKSPNWRKLECSWTIPYNPAQNKDYVTYLYNLTWHCNRNGTFCRVENGYRPEDPFPVLHVLVKNALGARNFTHFIDNWAAVIPNPAETLSVVEKSSTRISVAWTIPIGLQDFPPGLSYRLDVRGVSSTFEESVTGTVKGNKRWEEEVDVPYPYHEYEVTLRFRSARRNSTTDDHWNDGWTSVNATASVTINPVAPWSAPEVGDGTYSVEKVEGTMTLTVMWRKLPEVFHNGPGLRYSVTCRNTGGLAEYINGTINPFAVFENLSLNEQYSVSIRAENNEGPSNTSSKLLIRPSLPPPPVLPVVVFHSSTNQYELRWTPEDRYTYTVYICTELPQDIKACQGDLSWRNVGNVPAVNLTLEEMNIDIDAQRTDPSVHFALSAENGEGVSSGISWDRCTWPQSYNPSSGPPDVEIKDIGTESVKVSWGLSCGDRGGVVEGVQVQVRSGNSSSQVKDVDETLEEVELTGLTPGTDYTVSFRILYRRGYSEWSSEEEFLTLEEGRPISALVVVLIASGSVVALIVLIAAGRGAFRRLDKTRMELTRKINMPSAPHDIRIEENASRYKFEGMYKKLEVLQDQTGKRPVTRCLPDDKEVALQMSSKYEKTRNDNEVENPMKGYVQVYDPAWEGDEETVEDPGTTT